MTTVGPLGWVRAAAVACGASGRSCGGLELGGCCASGRRGKGRGQDAEDEKRVREFHAVFEGKSCGAVGCQSRQRCGTGNVLYRT